MSKHDGHDAIVLDDAATLGEDLPHLGIVIVGGQIAGGLGAGNGAIPKARRTGDGLVYLVRQVGLAELGTDMANGALQPDVEEVGELRVVDVVVVGRVQHDGVHTARRDVQILGGAEGDIGRRSDVVFDGGSGIVRDERGHSTRTAGLWFRVTGHRRQLVNAASHFL